MAKKVVKDADSENEKRPSSIKDLAARLGKAVKGAHISVMSESTLADRDEFVETPSYNLNRILSGDLRRGIPRKTWTLLVAPEHAGKSSFIALLAAKAKEKFDSTIIVIDTEGGWDKNFISRWGLNPEEVLYIYTPWVDEIKVLLTNLIEGEDDNFIVVVDSIGGIEKKKIITDAMAGTPKADQGTLQKELKVMYKMLANLVKTKNSIALSSGHYYGNPSGYGDADQIGGGKYLKLAVDITVAFKKQKLYNKSKEIIGNLLTATTMKNRMYPPFNEAVIEIDFKKGINKYAGLLDIAVEADIVEKGGSWYYWTDSEGQRHSYQGAEKAEALFEEYGEFIIDELNEFVSKSGFSTVNTELKNMIDNMDLEDEDEDESVTNEVIDELVE